MSTKIPVSSIPELMTIWDWESNAIPPETLGKRSDEKVWWICPKGHEHYLQSPRQKARKNTGCPRCNIEQRNQKRNVELIKEKGSLIETHPDIVEEWDYDKNLITPNYVLAGSHVKYWWKCARCKEPFLMSPNLRSSKGRGCPKCGLEMRGKTKRKNQLKKYGTLAETHAYIASEWDYSKNCDTPHDVHLGMQDERWWICSYGHPSYHQAIRDRVRRGYGCPVCRGEHQTSFPEQAIYYYIRKAYPDAKNRYRDNGYEIDIYIPCLKIGLEYDGSFWHKYKREKEMEKDAFFARKGIRIIRIKEIGGGECSVDEEDILWVKATSNYGYIEKVVKDISVVLGTVIDDVDIKRDLQVISNEYLCVKKEKSLQRSFPQLSLEWDYEKNIITPDKVSPYSRKKVNWICPDCNNRYEMIVGDRTGKKKCGCP